MGVRKATQADSQGIYELEEMSFSKPWSKVSIDQEFENPVATYFVAEQDGQVIGYVGVWSVVGEGQITNVAVHKDYRGQGFGRQLIQALIAFAEEVKLEILLLEVRESNESAKKLYEGSGFEVIGKRKQYYTQPTEDALLMAYYVTNS